VIGEVGINHAGSVEIAKAVVAMCKAFGVDMVKFQKRSVRKVYDKKVLAAPKLTPWGDTKLHDKIGLEFGYAEYQELHEWCHRLDIPWFASPWDCDSVDFLMEFSPPYMKIASACAYNGILIDKLVETGVPLIMSVGMHPQEEIPEVIDRANKAGTLKCVMLCASTYPTPDASTNLRGLETLREMLNGTEIKLGYSHHSRRAIHLALAHSLGADVLECHVALDKSFGGDDHMASLGPGGLKKAMEHLRVAAESMGSGLLKPTASALKKLAQYGWVK
jgi:N-acetylneuraminate synthase